jgi:hypothetical protein
MASAAGGGVTLLQNYKNIREPKEAVEMIKWYVNAFNKFAQTFLGQMSNKSDRQLMVKNLKEYILKEYIHDVRSSATRGMKKGLSKDALAFLTTVSTANANEHAYVSDILSDYGMEIKAIGWEHCWVKSSLRRINCNFSKGFSRCIDYISD